MSQIDSSCVDDIARTVTVVVAVLLVASAIAPVAAGFDGGGAVESGGGAADADVALPAHSASGAGVAAVGASEFVAGLTTADGDTYNYTARNAVAVNGDTAYVISEGQILTIDLSTGATVNSFAAPDGTDRGLAYGAGSLWYADANADPYGGEILELDPETGEVRSRILTSYDPYGLAFGDGSLWAGEVTGVPNTVREFAPNGTLVGQFTMDGPPGSTGPHGLAYYNGSVWVGTHDGLYEYGPNGAVEQSFESRETGYEGLASTGTVLYGPDETGNLSVLRRTGDADRGNYTARNAVAVNGDTAYVISAGQILTIDLSTRDLIASFEAPNGTDRGLAYGAGSLWYADANDQAYGGEILELDPETGEVRSRIVTSYDPYGLAFGDGSLWAGEVTGVPNTVREFAPNGTLVGQFGIDGPAGSTGPHGLAYFDGSVWVGTHDGLYDLGPDGAVQQSFESRETGYEGLASTGTVLYGPDETGNLSVLRRVDPAPDEPPAAPNATGVSTGDPHLITFDGLAYDFQAAGEFVLVREPGDSLEVQARQVPVGDSADVTVNTAVATRLDGHTLTVDARDATPVSVDGEAVAVNATAPMSVGDGRVFYDDGATAYTVVYPGADGEVDAGDTQLVADVVGDRIDVTVHVDPSDHDRLTGLLGDADGGPADDLALANGTTLSRPPSFDALYGPFRASWRVNESTSLFDYENGTGPSTYYNADVPSDPVTLDDFDDAAVEDARQRALDAGLTEGTVNFRNALIDYLLTGDASYFDSAAGAPETPESNLTVPSDPVRNLTGATVDGFEDGTLTEYMDVESARTTTGTVYAGNRSLVITDRNDDIDTDAQGLIGNTINRTFDATAPSRLTAAIRADAGYYNTVAVQWKNASGSVIHGTRVLNYFDGLYYGGRSGTTLQSASGNTWYYVELVDVDWDSNVIGEIRVNGQRQATNVSFVNPGDSVSEVRLVVHDGGTGSVGYFDEVTVGGAAPTEDEPTVDVAVDDPVPVGTATTINVTGTGVAELRITGETADWVVNDTRPATLTTYPTPGELPYTGQANDTWAQLYSAPGTHSFEVVATPPAGSGTYNFTATGLRNGTAVERTFTVEVRRGEHESGVSYRLFGTVAGNDGTLERADVIAALRGYLNDGSVAGVPISREDVIALVQYYLVQ